jgi:hypothetical protein
MLTPDENTPDIPNETPNIPRTDLDFLNTSKKITYSWQLFPQITLVYINQADMSNLVNNYYIILIALKSTVSQRPEFNKKLELVNIAIDHDIENVKRYREEKYGKVTVPFYRSQFGIVMEHKIYKLPKDHDDRKGALELLIPAFKTHGIHIYAFGLAYWTDVLEKF